ncbi:MAG TPA: hypothetical protein VG247_00045 [Pseudonocardiaceae bacterium]|jgi:hypothetical protein|nr:hypothetical protein [Pseudonocardiaceae bacterium]
MGAFAVLDDKPYVRIPDSFRFSDENPMTLDPYGECEFGDLPDYAQNVITFDLELTPAEWDAHVAQRDTRSIVGYWRAFSIKRWLAAERRRRPHVEPGPKQCRDCWGTCVMFDDGSISGTDGAPLLCMCCGG